MSKVRNPFLTAAGDELPTQYDRPPQFEGFIEERNIRVKMRDGVVLESDPAGLMGYVAVPYWKWFENIPYA